MGNIDRNGIVVVWDKDEMKDIDRRGGVPSYRTAWKHQDAALVQQALVNGLGLTTDKMAGPKKFEEAQKAFFEKFGNVSFPKEVVAADTSGKLTERQKDIHARFMHLLMKEQLTEPQIIKKMQDAGIPQAEIDFETKKPEVKKELF